MKNIESKNKTDQNNSELGTRPNSELKKLETSRSPLKLGDDKQVSRDLTKLYEQDLKF